MSGDDCPGFDEDISIPEDIKELEIKEISCLNGDPSHNFERTEVYPWLYCKDCFENFLIISATRLREMGINVNPPKIKK